MKKYIQRTASIAIVGILLASFAAPLSASATTFNRNRIINDVVFDNVSTMNSSSINNFLNSFPASCISPNSGFRAIKPVGYSPTEGYRFDGFVTAGEVIHEAAQAYGLNPQVLLATLQKEQSLVTGAANNYCNNGDHKYAAALGFGCPDSGGTYSYSNVNLYQRNGVTRTSIGSTCVNSAVKAGFSQQVIRAAWLLKFGQQRSKGNVNWAVIKGGWDNSDDPQSCYGGPMTQGTFRRCPSGAASYYDGYQTIDGAAVHMDTGATASLYWYTPHFHGNENFFALFNQWFGSPLTSNTPYQWSIDSQQAFADAARTKPYSRYTSLQPGQTAYFRIIARNFGFKTWEKSVVRLATTFNRDRQSVFSNGTWLSPNRIAMQETSVLPGETATFEFSVTAPSQPGTYYEYFSLVAEGERWMNELGMYYQIDVVPTQPVLNSQGIRLNSGQSLLPGNHLASADGQSTVSLDLGGAVVVRNSFLTAWSNGVSNGNVKELVMQSDGNLVEYAKNGQAIWASNTAGNNGAYLIAQTDGNAVIYTSGGQPLWSSSTPTTPDGLQRVTERIISNGVVLRGQQFKTANGAYRLIMQSDGNLVLYSPNRAVWASNTAGKSGTMLVMQTDGNLVLYASNGQALWSSRTNNRNGYQTVLQSDGNFVLYDNTGRPIWASNTAGRQ